MKLLRTLSTLIIVCAIQLASAGTTYYVALNGDDAHDGRSAESAFRTVQHGINALAAGDTLSIHPGEYRESVSREDLGNAESETVIRAVIPGTVILRGDSPIDGFKKVKGTRMVWETPLGKAPQSVIERDSFLLLDEVNTPGELEFRPGTYFYDTERKMLQLSTSDMRPALVHHYSIAVIDATGLKLTRPHRVVIDGIAATGFDSKEPDPRWQTFLSRWGIYLNDASECTVRNCTAWLNGGGIGMSSLNGGGNVIENSTAYANYSKFNVEGGNIISFHSDRDTIRNSRSFLSKAHGMRFYGSREGGDNLYEDVIAWANKGGDIWIKGIRGGETPGGGRAVRAISGGKFQVLTLENSLIGTTNWYNRDPADTPDTIRLAEEGALTLEDEFADPLNLDYRLQSTSRFRDSGPGGSDRGPHPYSEAVFYVSPDGADDNDGLSTATPWRSLARALKTAGTGDTVYLLEGHYGEGLNLSGDLPSIRGRGTAQVTLGGTVSGKNITVGDFRNLTFAEDVVFSDSANLQFRNCNFTSSGPVQFKSTAGIRLTHGVLTTPLEFKGTRNIYLSGNLYAGNLPAVEVDALSAVAFSDYNSYPSASGLWRIAAATSDLDQLRADGFERYSVIAAAAVEVQAGVVADRTPGVLRGIGPLGTAIGNYWPRVTPELQVTEPAIHSVTATTANLEWWSSLPVRVELRWGQTPSCQQGRQLTQLSYGSYSLTELEPETTYYYELRVLEAADSPFSIERRKLSSPLLYKGQFVTGDVPHTARTYYISPEGSDDADGRSPQSAWKSINHAASRVGPGDTVELAAGDYRETTWLRATGTRERPITFRAAPDARVVFDGGTRQLFAAFVVFGKEGIRFDGFYGVGLGKIGGHDGAFLVEELGGMFVISDSRDIVMTRCWLDGRGRGYSVPFANVFHSSDIHLQNCILQEGFSGPKFVNCDDTLIENCIFFRNMISTLLLINRADQRTIVRNCIITDNLAVKAGVPLISVGRLGSLELDNNCFYLRRPLAERPLVMAYGDVAYERAATAYDVEIDRTGLDLSSEENPKLVLTAIEAEIGPTRTIAADPGFPALADVPATDKNGEPAFPVDYFSNRDPEFQDLFTTNPELIERNIGLQPQAF